jgi:hypothetical protein
MPATDPQKALIEARRTAYYVFGTDRAVEARIGVYKGLLGVLCKVRAGHAPRLR